MFSHHASSLLQIVLLAICGSVFAQNLPAQSKPGLKYSPLQAAVWKMEETYWRVRQANDAEKFWTLWHPRAIGWPADEPHPVRGKDLAKFTLGRLFSYELAREAVEVFASTGVTTYIVLFTNEKDRKLSTQRRRVTHTWIKTREGWQIVGGMSMQLPVGE